MESNIKKKKSNKLVKKVRWATTKCKCGSKDKCYCKKGKYKFFTEELENKTTSRCIWCKRYTVIDGECNNDYCKVNN